MSKQTFAVSVDAYYESNLTVTKNICKKIRIQKRSKASIGTEVKFCAEQSFIKFSNAVLIENSELKLV